MISVDNISRMSTLAKMAKKEGKSIGFVPTMGYLHEGHLSLAKSARKHTDLVIMSIFVNPIQFGAGEDFDKYPRDIKRDEDLARSAGVDIIFCPSSGEMYPCNFATYVNVERLTEGLCARARPGHFKGVCTVVAKLFCIVRPDIAYFGQKDAQQAIIIKKMSEDLNTGIEIKILPTVRESDGLAMSSRNMYLSESERRSAAVIYGSLEKAESMVKKGETDSNKISGTIKEMILKIPDARIDYISIVDIVELKELAVVTSQALIAVAVYIGKTRLIDNIIVNPAACEKVSKKGSR